jgi:Secretion system C-terminal sorting domain
MSLLRVYCAISLLSVGALHAQAIVNGDFELGTQGWTVYSKGGYKLIGTAADFASSEITPAITPHSGQYMGRLGGFGNEVNSLSQTVTLPNVKPLYLKDFVQDRNSSISDCSAMWEGARIRVIIAGQTIYDIYSCPYYQTSDWIPVYFDVSAVAGQTVQIIIQADCASDVWSFLYIDDVSLTNQITDVEAQKSSLLRNFELDQNYPNPFNPSTTIRYSLPSATFVTITVCNTLGQVVATLVQADQEAGYHEVGFDGGRFASGVYFYHLQTANQSVTRKLVLLK